MSFPTTLTLKIITLLRCFLGFFFFHTTEFLSNKVKRFRLMLTWHLLHPALFGTVLRSSPVWDSTAFWPSTAPCSRETDKMRAKCISSAYRAKSLMQTPPHMPSWGNWALVHVLVRSITEFLVLTCSFTFAHCGNSHTRSKINAPFMCVMLNRP